MKNKVKKVALVTGANRGIGFEVVKQLSGLGAKVILTARNEAKGNAARDALLKENKGAEILFRQLDVTDQTSVDRMLAFVVKEFRRLDILINNAGIFTDQNTDGHLADMDKIIDTFTVNTMGPLRMCRAFIPLMFENRYGRVVNVSSGMGQLSTMSGKWPAYRISKTALNAVTRILADEVKDMNITVNSVCPGWVRTDLGGPDAPNTPEQAVGTILWLANLETNEPSGGFFRDMTRIEW